MKFDNKASIIIPLLLIATIFIIGASYAWLSYTISSNKNIRIKGTMLDLVLDDKTSEGISINKMIPMTDLDGLEQKAYTFKVQNNGSVDVDYSIYLDDIDLETGEKKIPDEFINYQLSKNNVAGSVNNLGANSRLLKTDLLSAGSTDTYSLKIWINSNATTLISGSKFKTQIRVEAQQKIE